MEIKERSPSEMSARMQSMSDFVKMDYLEQCIKEKGDFLTKKFCCQKLAELYMRKGMHSTAAKHMEAIARMSETYEEKINSFMKEVEILVEGSLYSEAETILNKALSFATKMKAVELKKEFIQMLKDKAERLEKTMKLNKALETYEFLYKAGDEIDKKAAKEKMLYYYNRLGKIREYFRLKET